MTENGDCLRKKKDVRDPFEMRWREPGLPEGLYRVSMRGATEKMLRGFPGEPVGSGKSKRVCKFVGRDCAVNGVIVPERFKRFRYDLQKKDFSHVVYGDCLLFNKYYPNDVAITDIVDRNTMFSSDYYLLVPNKEIVDPYYLLAILSNHRVRMFISFEENYFCESPVKYVKLDDLRDILLPIVTKDRQVEIASECRRLVEIIKEDPVAHSEEYEQICHLADDYAMYMKMLPSKIQYMPYFL